MSLGLLGSELLTAGSGSASPLDSAAGSLPVASAPVGTRAVSRRHLLRTATGGAALALSAGMWVPGLTAAASTGPRPVPGGIDPFKIGHLFHVHDFGGEPSTIVDFRGIVGIAHIGGMGTVTRAAATPSAGTPVTTGARLVFDADMRFMQGSYVGEDGQLHDGTFGFI